MHEGTSGDRSLVVAVIALVQTTGEFAMPLTAALRADKALWPTSLCKVGVAITFGGIFPGKSLNADTLWLGL